jgi:uncharacterized protein YndB with AHSA1/START domain
VITIEGSERSVRRAVTVDVDRERAFSVFTEGLDTWWMRSHHIGAAEIEVAILEPRQGGRWYERGVDGTQCDWGHVIEWEPPGRIVLAWQINGRWQYDPSLVTEVEVTSRRRVRPAPASTSSTATSTASVPTRPRSGPSSSPMAAGRGCSSFTHSRHKGRPSIRHVHSRRPSGDSPAAASWPSCGWRR